MAGISTNRTDITVPADISAEIIQKTQEDSAVMQLARHIELPGRGTEVPVITSDPTAAWVSETGAKPVSNPGLSKKIMSAYKLAVIVPFSKEFQRDLPALYDALVQRLPLALAKQFDATVIGAVEKPGSNFDNFASCTAQLISTDAYAGLVAADGDIAENGGVMDGVAISPQGKSVLLGATDQNKRPLFINNVSEGAVPMVLGAKTVLSKGMYAEGVSADVVGVAGDWSQAVYGTVEGVKIDYSDQATLVTGVTGAAPINLFQQNMFAVRAEIELGFRADTSCFDKLTAAPQGATGATN